jgi:hypothetical protein
MQLGRYRQQLLPANTSNCSSFTCLKKDWAEMGGGGGGTGRGGSVDAGKAGRQAGDSSPLLDIGNSPTHEHKCWGRGLDRLLTLLPLCHDELSASHMKAGPRRNAGDQELPPQATYTGWAPPGRGGGGGGPPTHHTSPGSEHGLAIVQQLPAALNRCRAASKGLYTCTRGLQGAHKCLYTLPLCCCCQRATVQSSKLRQQLQLCCSYY